MNFLTTNKTGNGLRRQALSFNKSRFWRLDACWNWKDTIWWSPSRRTNTGKLFLHFSHKRAEYSWGRMLWLLELGYMVQWMAMDSSLKVWDRKLKVSMWEFMKVQKKSPERTGGSKFGRTVCLTWLKEIQLLRGVWGRVDGTFH